MKTPLNWEFDALFKKLKIMLSELPTLLYDS